MDANRVRATGSGSTRACGEPRDDLASPTSRGKKPVGTDLVNRYMDKVINAGQHDDEVVIRLNETLALLRSPLTLMTPTFANRVLHAARRGTAASDIREATPTTTKATTS